MKLLPLSFFIFVPTLLGERILVLTPLGTKSHKIFFMGIAEALAQRGHQLTVVSSFEPFVTNKDIREVIITLPELDSLLESSFTNSHDVIKNLFFHSSRLCSDSLGQSQVQALKKERFDLLMISMFFDYCFLSFVYDFQVPFIYLSPAGLYGPFADMMGNVDFPSFVPNKLMQSHFPLSFTERLMSTALNTFLTSIGIHFFDFEMLRICQEKSLCAPDMPSLREINKNASLAIINSVRSLEWPPRPTMPNIVYAGGIHIKLPKKLPQDLEEWISASGSDGFIFFSLGSALKSSFVPESYRKILIKVFGSLKQRVLWKWDQETMADLPQNVKLAKWLPQPDVLGHPKLRLFITHGGLLSTLESTYHGIPIIGMPVFADQFANMREAETEGWAKVVDWKELEEESFRSLILDTINNKKLEEISKRRSVLMRETPISPAEDAVFWVEYVLRHGGAPHLMSPVRHMEWYEVYNIDVWLLITALTVAWLYVSWLLIKLFLRTCLEIFVTDNDKRKEQ